MLPTPDRKKVSELSELEIYSNAWRAAHGLEWLFPEREEVMTSSDYLEYFNKEHGPFHVCTSPTSYKWEYLEANKEKIVFSSHIITDGGIVLPYTVLQCNKDFHLIMNWVWQPEETAFGLNANLIYKAPKDYYNFLEENVKYQLVQSEGKLGFNSQHSGFGVN